MRVVGRLQQEWRDRAQHGRLAHPRRAVRGQIARHLAGAHREADQHDISKVQLLDQRVQIGGEGVVVVANRRLAGLAEATTVVRDHAVAGPQEHAFLAFPRVPVEGIAVDEHHRRAAAVVLVVELDVGVVLGPDSDS